MLKKRKISPRSCDELWGYSDNFRPDIFTSTDFYAERFKGKTGKYFLDTQLHTILGFLLKYRGGKILEVGGGHGQLSTPLCKIGCNYYVVGSKSSCRHRLEDKIEKSQLKFATCDLQSLPFRDNEFDVVIAIRLIAHINDWEHLISEMSRIAKSAIIVDYPDKMSFNYFYDLFFKAKYCLEKGTRNYRVLKNVEIKKVLKDNGFVRIKSKRQFLLPMVFHRFLSTALVSKMLENSFEFFRLKKYFGSPIILSATKCGEPHKKLSLKGNCK